MLMQSLFSNHFLILIQISVSTSPIFKIYYKFNNMSKTVQYLEHLIPAFVGTYLALNFPLWGKDQPSDKCQSENCCAELKNPTDGNKPNSQS